MHGSTLIVGINKENYDFQKAHAQPCNKVNEGNSGYFSLNSFVFLARK